MLLLRGWDMDREVLTGAQFTGAGKALHTVRKRHPQLCRHAALQDEHANGSGHACVAVQAKTLSGGELQLPLYFCCCAGAMFIGEVIAFAEGPADGAALLLPG